MLQTLTRLSALPSLVCYRKEKCPPHSPSNLSRNNSAIADPLTSSHVNRGTSFLLKQRARAEREHFDTILTNKTSGTITPEGLPGSLHLRPLPPAVQKPATRPGKRPTASAAPASQTKHAGLRWNPNLVAADLRRIKDILKGAWAESTRESYGTGLLTYHVFCDCKGITEQQQAPASHLLIASFIATIARAYSGKKSINNYVYGI
ncbi:hypothetical protein B0H34DRAFT_800176 [Crassisporium funariophilum]|nr:hypothetical protein B0H34DRAFT_800176 [Crassisporium funariophilum]